MEQSPSGWGIDYTFECIGNVEVGGVAFCHRSYDGSRFAEMRS